MKRSLFAAITTSLLVGAAPAFAGGCPPFIGNPKTKQSISTKGMTCSSGKIKGTKVGEVLATGKFKLQTSIDDSGQGQKNTKPFQVGKNPPTITYSYNDPQNRGSFTITAIDLATHRKVEVLVATRGSVEGSTALNWQGVFYLQIKGDGDVKTDEDSPADWSVSVAFDDEGDDFGGDFGF